MSDNRPIGIFDSGLGGLTVAKEIYQLLPHESTIYLGDTARVPYGNRSQDTITHFATEAIHFLQKADVKAIVVACGTVSSVSLPQLQQLFPTIPLIGVIQPAAEEAINTTHNHTIGVIGTNATINSRAFDVALKSINPKIKVFTQRCPLFVPIIEEGIGNHHPIMVETIKHYLSHIKQSSIDTLILGCTHYPIIYDTLAQYLPNTKLINVGTSVAKQLNQTLIQQHLQTNHPNPSHTYLVTDKNENFAKVAHLFLGQPITVSQISL